MYEPLYHEKILDGTILDIDKDNVITYKIVKSSCDFSKKFDYHMGKWKAEKIRTISAVWLELK